MAVAPRRVPAAPSRFIAWVLGGTALLNVLMLVATGLALEQGRTAHAERAAIATRNLAALLERDLLATIQKIDLALLAVSDEAGRVPGRPHDAGPALRAFVGRQEARLTEVHVLGVTDREGNMQAGYGGFDARPVNLADRTYFRDLERDPDAGLVVSRPVFGRLSGKPQLVFGRRLQTADGRFDGIVFATMDIRHFEDLFSQLELGAHGRIELRDAELRFVARFPALSSAPASVPASASVDPRVDPPPEQLRSALKDGRTSDTFLIGGVDGVERVMSFRRVGNYPFHAAVELDAEESLDDSRLEQRKAVAFALVFMAATGAVAFVVWKAWRRREADLQALGAQERKFRTVIESSPDALVIIDARDRIAIVNRQALAMFGYASTELIGQPLAMLVMGLSADVIEDAQRASGPARSTRLEDRWALTCTGREFPVSISLSPIETEDGGMVAAAIRDVTDRRASEARIAFLAHHDPLTSLPNRIVMQSRFAQAATQADRSGTKLALLFLDLDNFKTVNDSLGHQVGDALLRSVAARLRENTRDIDTISREGGDEFLLLLAQLPDADTANVMALRLVESFQMPLSVDDRSITMPFSIGIALYPDDGTDFGTLQKNADIAMYQAKAAGRNIHRFFNRRMNVEVLEQMQLRHGLRLALERKEFVLHYQPQFDLASGDMVGTEALVRWQHPQLGLIGPNRFIPDAEATGMIVPIGEWVLNEACRQARAWLDSGLPSMVVAVNLSAVQFARGDVEATVRAAIALSGIDPAYLELELTESILIQDVESVLATVQALKRLGVKLAIDDFGTGYSSLSYLTRFAVDKLKIDRSFVAGLATDSGHAAIVRAIVQMGHGLGLKTVAEGVEDAATCQQLIDLGCNEAQGFLFARPMPPDALESGFFSMKRSPPRPSSAWPPLLTDIVELPADG